jgi:hypothetical protein
MVCYSGLCHQLLDITYTYHLRGVKCFNNKPQLEFLAEFLYQDLFVMLTDHISVQTDSWLGHQGAKAENTKSAMTPELMAGSSPNFYHRYLIKIHGIIPGF